MPPPLPHRLQPHLRVLFGAGLIVSALLFVTGLGMVTIAQVSYQQTISMQPTLLRGDRLLSVRHIFMDPIRRGDLLVFSYPVDPSQILVKRVVGIPGDRVRIVNKAFHLNGRAVEEPYVQHATDYVDSYRDNFPSEPNQVVPERGRAMLDTAVRNNEAVVPQGQYFVLGDNRDVSLDSRYWGFVPEDAVIGRPILVVTSFDDAAWRSNRTFLRLRRITLDSVYRTDAGLALP